MSDIKIKSVYKELTYYVTTENGQHFRRDLTGHWEQLYNDSWEPADAESIEQPLEQAYQKFMRDYE